MNKIIHMIKLVIYYGSMLGLARAVLVSFANKKGADMNNQISSEITSSAVARPIKKQPIKDDLNKPDFNIIDPFFAHELAEVLSMGGEKYGRGNFMEKEGLGTDRVLNAAHRHLNAFMRGENNDLESGKSHLIHAVAEIMFAYNFIRTGKKDDRIYGKNDDRIYEKNESVRYNTRLD